MLQVFPNKKWKQAARVLLVLVLGVTFLGANDEDPRFKRLGNSMMCMCGCNQILLQCNHVGCGSSDPMRKELLQMVSAGMTDDQIYNAFTEKYGAVVLAAPTTKGFNLVAWVTIPLVSLAATFLVFLIVRRWRLRPSVAEAPVATMPGVMDPYREKARNETEI